MGDRIYAVRVTCPHYAVGVICLTIILIRNCAIIEPLDHGCGRQNSKMAFNFLGLVYIHLLPGILSNTSLGTAIKGF